MLIIFVLCRLTENVANQYYYKIHGKISAHNHEYLKKKSIYICIIVHIAEAIVVNLFNCLSKYACYLSYVNIVILRVCASEFVSGK